MTKLNTEQLNNSEPNSEKALAFYCEKEHEIINAQKYDHVEVRSMEHANTIMEHVPHCKLFIEKGSENYKGMIVVLIPKSSNK